GAAKSAIGGRALIKLAQAKELDDRLASAAAFPLSTSPVDEIRAAAAKLFPLPAAKGNQKLPPISQLTKMTGDVLRGSMVFMKTGECAQCHKVNKAGKEVGPDLSEIGGKLSRQALLESIIY
ncbi:MAG: c-type cytochrome, partial [Planctomycetes bacterium]|nr:c-type cytochrome [Planctomycetota bacterium]